jgi:two-component system OmpR family response regulator/two-component system response regulator QseB
MRILLAEDDALLGDGLQAGLRQAGFDVDWARDGIAAEHALAGAPYAALVLDLGLPRRSGDELLARLRAKGERLPVLILTARDGVGDRIRGLDGGADDYLAKPADLHELAARLRALIRRARGEAAPKLCAGEIELDPASREVTSRGVPVSLQPREFALLHELLLNAGRALSREQLEERLYAWGEEIGSNAVEVHVHHLRRKLGPDAIRTVRGVGYLVAKAGCG